MRYIAAVLLVLPSLATAASLTVAPGDSLSQAIARMASGDTLTIAAGTYTENTLRPPSGVTVQGAPGATVVLRPNGGAATGVSITSSGVTLRNLVIDGRSGGISYGMVITGTNNLIENVEVAFPQNQAIAIYCPDGNHPGCGGGHNTLRNVHVHHAGSGGCHGTTAKDGYCHGVYVYSDDNVIDGGEYDHNNGWGIQTYGRGLRVMNANVHDNQAGGLTASGVAVEVRNSVFSANDATGQNAVIWASGGTLRDVTIEGHSKIIGGLALSNVRINGSGGSGANLAVQASGSIAVTLPLPTPRNLRAISLP
jgi:hypothetical protein